MYSKFLWNINFIQNRTFHVLFCRLFFFSSLELCYGIFSELNCIFLGNHFNYLKVISFWRKNNFRLYLKFNEYTHEEVKQYNFLFQTRVCELLTLSVKLASFWPRLLMLKKKNYWYVPDLLAILFRSGDKVGENKAYRIASFFCLSGTLRGSTLSPCEQKLVAMPRPSLTFPKPVV